MASRQTGSTTRSKLMAVRSRTGGVVSVVLTGALAIVCGLAMSACAFQKDPKSKEKSKIEELEQQLDANRPLALADFSHEFIPGSIFKYEALVKWPHGRPFQIKISREGEPLVVLDGRTQNEIRIACKSDHVDYSVEIVSPVTGVVGNFSVRKKCPVDAEINRSVGDINVLRHVDGRLFMRNHAEIVLKNEPLALNLISLHIDGTAIIRTYRADRRYDLNEDRTVANAPSIQIRAKKISGDLKLELNGVDGKQLEDLSPEVDRSLNGASGKDGRLGARCGGPRRYDNTEVCQNICEQQPTSGENGKDAIEIRDGKVIPRVGSTGNNGLRGIGTSNVTIQVDDVADFSLRIEFNPGNASRPGLGSLPKGGRAGAPGQSPGAPCESANPARDGRDGIQGGMGNPAPNGSCGILSLSKAILKRTEMKDLNLSCSKFPGILREI